MRYLMFVVMLLTVLWSTYGQATEVGRMRFRLQSYGDRGYDVSSIWNSFNQVAMVRMGLVLENADEFLMHKSISFSTASEVELRIQDESSESLSCRQIDQWHLEYEPGLPNYLMYVALKGPGCEQVAKNFDILRVTFHFKGISLPHLVPIDVAVDISR